MAVREPPIPTEAVWLNVDRPLTAQDLRGRVVLWHFWTSACINCQHTLPILDAIERELEEEGFVALSVHSPKFPAQREAERVRDAVRQLEVAHPVLLDPDGSITRSFAVSGWPTLIFVDPRGYLLGVGRGEPQPQALLGAIRQALSQYRAEGALHPRPLPLRAEQDRVHRLAFPGAVAADAGSGRLFIADAGHHQVVACDAEGGELGRIGSGAPGWADGPAAGARFRRPCGLALAGGTLYVSDTGSHAVRAVDLRSGAVSTLVQGGGLRSPWGLAWDGRKLFIASAGTHQIWSLDPASGAAALFAGTGAEGGRDGPAASACFAQPSGLGLLGGVLYVADSETSSIRAISDLDGAARVTTLCGAGDLFGFGDADGAGPMAQLQHPIGLATGSGMLFVADTFNHKVRMVDPRTGSCRSLFGNGDAELDPAPAAGSRLPPAGIGVAAFCGPEGLAVRGEELLVADTGNHRVLAIGLAGGGRRVLAGD